MPFTIFRKEKRPLKLQKKKSRKMRIFVKGKTIVFGQKI